MIEGQTMQWPKRKGLQDKQLVHKTMNNTSVISVVRVVQYLACRLMFREPLHI